MTASGATMRTVATAGHVDHGKSSLVLALTGTDPDRFPEEKARGLTIDLGFAFTTLPSGQEVGFVDVPGHVRFIKNMLAGVGAVDVVMLVVAANEGWMPQSEEHLRIIELLGVRHGLVCLTKADLVDEDTLELARLALDERLAASVLGDAPVVVCDAVSGRGLDDVRAGLDTVLATAPEPVDRDRPRLWVDRVFAAKGAGTVVTGTLAGGSLRVDDEVEVGPRGGRGYAPSGPRTTSWTWPRRAHGSRSTSPGPGSSGTRCGEGTASFEPASGNSPTSSTSASSRSGTTRSAPIRRCSATRDRVSTRRSSACSTPPAGSGASAWTSACRWLPGTGWYCATPASETRSAAPRCSTPRRAGA